MIEGKCSLEIWHFLSCLRFTDSRSYVHFYFSCRKYLFMKWQNNVNTLFLGGENMGNVSLMSWLDSGTSVTS